MKVEPHLLLLCSSTQESRRLQEDFQTSLSCKSVVLQQWNTSGSSENPRHEISRENSLECGARRAGLTPGWHKHVFATVACLCELLIIMWLFQNSIELLHLQLWNLEMDLVFYPVLNKQYQGQGLLLCYMDCQQMLLISFQKWCGLLFRSRSCVKLWIFRNTPHLFLIPIWELRSRLRWFAECWKVNIYASSAC